MKKATVLGISANHKVILKCQKEKTLQVQIQGFTISPKLIHRICFDELINKEIQFSLNKNEKKIRYQNESFLINALKAGALQPNKKELEESKIFSQQQKEKLQSIPLNESFKDQANVYNLNLSQQRQKLNSFIQTKQQLEARVEYFSKSLLLRIVEGTKSYFLTCSLKNYKMYFQIFPLSTLLKTNMPFTKDSINVKIVDKKFNLLTNSTQVFVELSSQLTQLLLKQGFIAVDSKNLTNFTTQHYKKLSQAQIQAKKNHKGIYTQKSDILNFIYAKNNFVGTVTDIIEGYIYEIKSLKTNQVQNIQLSTVRCPVDQEPGAYECRQFARKNLIGRQVNINLHKNQGLKTTGNIQRVSDWKDIECLLLQNGMATVKQQLRNSILMGKYIDLQANAKTKKKGIHKKDLGNKRFQDLTELPSNKEMLNVLIQRRLQLLNSVKQKQQGMIHEIKNVCNFKIKLQCQKVIVNFKLEGVIAPFLNPNLPQYEEIQKYTKQFLNVNFRKRDVIVEINDFDCQANVYIGTLRFEKKKETLQQLLVKASLVYASQFDFFPQFKKAQESVKGDQKLIWQDNLRSFQPYHQLDKVNFTFEGRFSWIQDGRTVFVQPKENIPKIQEIQNQIRSGKLNKLDPQQIKIGAWCAAFYQGLLYRAVIVKMRKNEVQVAFIDWGNRDISTLAHLYQLPKDLLYVCRQCIQVKLNLVTPTRKLDCLVKMRQYCDLENTFVFKKLYGDVVEAFEGPNEETLSESLIYKGILKADRTQLKQYPNGENIKMLEEQLRKERLGIWEESDSEEELDQTIENILYE